MSELTYDEEYFCYAKNEYIGIATFTNDPYIGDSFIMFEVNKAGRIREIALVPDTWISKKEFKS